MAANGFPDDAKTVAVRDFPSHDAAELAAANLRAHGIECWINADDAGGMYPNLTLANGVRLLVRAAEADAAIALLNTEASASELSEIEAQAVAVPSPDRSPPGKLGLGGIFAGVVAGVLLCLLYQWTETRGTKTYYFYTKEGKRDQAWIYRNGHIVQFLADRNLDGVWDCWVYYENGRRVRAELDNNFDGKPDETWIYSNGVLVSMEKDTDFNGVPDEFCTYTNEIPQQMDFKPNGSKFATQRWIYKNGVLVEILKGGDANGNFKETEHYDAFFNRVPENQIPTNSAFELLPLSK